jgi:hypothetical protein
MIRLRNHTFQAPTFAILLTSRSPSVSPGIVGHLWMDKQHVMTGGVELFGVTQLLPQAFHCEAH